VKPNPALQRRLRQFARLLVGIWHYQKSNTLVSALDGINQHLRRAEIARHPNVARQLAAISHRLASAQRFV
jgi:hypothetical protein